MSGGKTGNAGKASKGAPPEPITPTPTAVVIDTSLWGRGTLDLSRLKSHAKRLGESGIAVWVPQQVLLEWVSHAVADVQEVLPIWKRLARTGLIAGGVPPVSTLSEIEKKVTSEVSAIPGVTVLPMTGDAAIAGIKDQILGTGPGATRSGVKTGAVDSSWIRDALAAASDDPSKLLFVTDNAKDVHETARAMGVTVNVRSEHHTYSSLFGATAAPDLLVNLITNNLIELLTPPDPADYHTYPAEFPVPLGDISLTTAAFDPPYALEVTDVTLMTGGSIVAIADVEVIGGSAVEGAQGARETATNEVEGGARSYHHTVELRILMLGDLEVTGYQIDQDGQVVMQTDGVSNALVVAQFVADISDRNVKLTAAGDARADSAEQRFDDPHEALEWVLEFLGSLHGVNLDNDDVTQQEFTFFGINGLTVAAELVGEAYSDWTLAFHLGSDTIAVSCHFDPNFRVWAGKDSFDMWPPYYLAEGEGGTSTTAEPFTALGRVWRYLNGLSA